MIDLIIWSFDRASQLNTLLTSIRRNCNIFNIKIVYNFSNKFFQDGYIKLIADNTTCFWTRDNGDFEEQTKFALAHCRTDYVSFSTDDCVFHKKVDKSVLEAALPEFDNQVFSFRLGYNTLEQDIHRGTKQPPLNMHAVKEGWIAWDVNKYHPHDNYGYPFGLDLHVFRRDLINNLLKNMDFNSTNQLETNLCGQRGKIDEMRAFFESVAVNIPINTINNTTITGLYHPISKEELNEKWLNGEVIDVEDVENTKFIGCHQEHNFKFVKE